MLGNRCQQKVERNPYTDRKKIELVTMEILTFVLRLSATKRCCEMIRRRSILDVERWQDEGDGRIVRERRGVRYSGANLA